MNEEVIAIVDRLFASFQQGTRHMHINSELHPPSEIGPIASVQDNSDNDATNITNNIDSINWTDDDISDIIESNSDADVEYILNVSSNDDKDGLSGC